MRNFSSLDEHKFQLAVLNDGETEFKGIEVQPYAVELPKEIELTEYQYYIQKVGFYMVHTTSWCKQLDLAIEFLSNFDYSQKKATRAEHLIYNVENYFIRLKSVHDRLLQLVNAVFHLCINEANVNHGIIVSNYKVQHRPHILKAIKKVCKYLNEHEQIRHTLIHRHSLMDENLKKIELFYLNNFEHIGDKEVTQQYKYVRTEKLRRFLSDKKEEFRNINLNLSELINELLTLLNDEYKRQKKALV